VLFVVEKGTEYAHTKTQLVEAILLNNINRLLNSLKDTNGQSLLESIRALYYDTYGFLKNVEQSLTNS
jgi:hypothetical protein